MTSFAEGPRGKLQMAMAGLASVRRRVVGTSAHDPIPPLDWAQGLIAEAIVQLEGCECRNEGGQDPEQQPERDEVDPGRDVERGGTEAHGARDEQQ